MSNTTLRIELLPGNFGIKTEKTGGDAMTKEGLIKELVCQLKKAADELQHLKHGNNLSLTTNNRCWFFRGKMEAFRDAMKLLKEKPEAK